MNNTIDFDNMDYSKYKKEFTWKWNKYNDIFLNGHKIKKVIVDQNDL